MLTKQQIVEGLQKDLLLWAQAKPGRREKGLVNIAAPLVQNFPGHRFPSGCMHECIIQGDQEYAATAAFVVALTSSFIQPGATIAWVSKNNQVFAPALKPFGILPNNILFIKAANNKQLLWATEECLKTAGIQVLLADITDYSFMHTRRFQLATEQSGVTGFLLNNSMRKPAANTCVSRWIIKSSASHQALQLPGVGCIGWQVQLEKMRNGKPGQWLLYWNHNKLQEITAASQPETAAEKIAG